MTVTIPDAKLASLTAARDAYNARTGSSLTTKQWGFLVVKLAVITELNLKAEADSKVTTDAAKATYTSTLTTEQAALSQQQGANAAGWE